MLAAAARAGAPLGHDFCAINLSDNLKPWPVIEKRLRLAAEADFAIAIYNPRSASRPDGFARALDVLREAGCGDRTIIFAHAVTTPKERIETMSLARGAARDGRHGNARHRRQFGDAPGRPLGLCAEARVMTEPRHHLLDALDPRPLGQSGARDHDRRAGRARARRRSWRARRCRRNCARRGIRCRASASARDRLERERTARDDHFGVGQRQRAIGRIDEAQRVGVLRLCGERREVLPADGKEHARGCVGQGGNGGCRCRRPRSSCRRACASTARAPARSAACSSLRRPRPHGGSSRPQTDASRR